MENSTGAGRGPRPESQGSDVDMPSIAQNTGKSAKNNSYLLPGLSSLLGISLQKLTNCDRLIHPSAWRDLTGGWVISREAKEDFEMTNLSVFMRMSAVGEVISCIALFDYLSACNRSSCTGLGYQ
jgi:hypothetical protein